MSKDIAVSFSGEEVRADFALRHQLLPTTPAVKEIEMEKDEKMKATGELKESDTNNQAQNHQVTIKSDGC